MAATYADAQEIQSLRIAHGAWRLHDRSRGSFCCNGDYPNRIGAPISDDGKVINTQWAERREGFCELSFNERRKPPVKAEGIIKGVGKLGNTAVFGNLTHRNHVESGA